MQTEGQRAIAVIRSGPSFSPGRPSSSKDAPTPPPTEAMLRSAERDAQAWTMYQRGMRVWEIAYLWNVTRQAVYQRLERHEARLETTVGK